MTELLPLRGSFRPGEPVEVEVRGAGAPLELALLHLDRELDRVTVHPDDPVGRFGALPEGGYGVETAGAATAVEVIDDPLRRLRYGFVADFAAGRDPGPVAETVRRLHLNAVQFYDWMYRHAELLPPADAFDDPLGRPLSLATVRALVRAVDGAGALPLGYAAVYAAGAEHWPEWRDESLYRADGTPWTLGEDFLWIVDPGSERWQEHFSAQLAAAAREVGFAGFHLDQFGAPKRARRRDGTAVELAQAFPSLIERLARDLPEARLVFNNVNDFPTWSTAPVQDATYVEVWSPHDRLDHLGSLVTRARAFGAGGVALAAYLSVFGDGDEAVAREAMRLELATVFSHGGTCLLHGEERSVLTDPYYVRNHRMDDETAETARLYQDFSVRYGDLLFDAAVVDVTRTHAGGVNEEIRVAAEVPVSTDCVPGALWLRVLSGAHGLVVSLLDLSAQDETGWNAPKREPAPVRRATIAVERAGTAAPRALAASPERPGLVDAALEFDGRRDTIHVPPFRTWTLVWIPDAP